MKKVLFVCLGNICRSPAAEGVFTHLVKKAGLSKSIEVDSAGTSASHVGERADKRMRDHAKRRGIELESISRKFTEESDFAYFDHIIVMDKSNYKDVLSKDKKNQYLDKVQLFSEYRININSQEVPDPYYGGSDGFERVLDIVEDCSQGLLNKLSENDENR